MFLQAFPCGSAWRMHILSSGKFVMKRRSLPQQISGQLTVCVCVCACVTGRKVAMLFRGGRKGRIPWKAVHGEKLQCFPCHNVSIVGGKGW